MAQITPERAVSLGIPAEIWEPCRLPLSGLPAPPPAPRWAPGPPDGMPPCSPPPSPPRPQGKPEPPSNETQASLTERPGFLLTPSSHRQPRVHQGHLGDADNSAVLQAHSPSSCDPRAGAFSCLTDRWGPWPLGRPGQGQGGGSQAGRGHSSSIPSPPLPASPATHPTPSRHLPLWDTAGSAMGAPFSVIKKPLLSNKGSSGMAGLLGLGCQGPTGLPSL